ncbi:MAG TPA: hypothetical protein VL738_34730 [Dactylosporangium sp.]|nr:hypothetical protein [Dactylosporangium sp.]
MLGAYLRHPVAEIGALDLLGPEATGFVGDAGRRRLRQRGVGGPGLGLAAITLRVLRD